MVGADQHFGHACGKSRFFFGVDGGGVNPFVVDGGRGPKTQGHTTAQLTQALLHHVLHIGIEGAHSAHQNGLVRNHTHRTQVTRLHGTQADHRRIDGPDITRHQALHRRDDVGGHQHRVHCLVRMGPMPTPATDLDGDAVRRCHHGPHVDAHRARPHRRPVVHGVDRLHREALEQAILNHHAGTGKTLLTGLKNQHGCAVEPPGFCQITCRTNQHRHVAIVPTAMHQPAFA